MLLGDRSYLKNAMEKGLLQVKISFIDAEYKYLYSKTPFWICVFYQVLQ